MQLLWFAAVLAFASASPALLGSNKCTFGPSYWCSHIRHAKQCGAMEHCISAVWKYNIVPVKSEVKCEMCVFAVTEARRLLKDNATKEQLSEFLMKGCELLPDANLQKECTDIVKNYLPEILQLITSDVDPKAVCSAIGMCTAELNKQETPAPEIAAPDLCADCKKFMNDLEIILKDNQTVSQIEAQLDILCGQLGPVESMCKQLVAQYVPLVLNMLSSEFNPQVTCRILGLCKSGNVKDAMEFRLKFLALVKQIPMTNNINGPEECSVCKTVMGELQKLDRDAKTQQQVENLLKHGICPLFGALKAECEQLIVAYSPMIFEYLANELDPDVACKTLHLCTAVQRTIQPISAVSVVKSVSVVKAQPAGSVGTPPKKVSASVQCVLCEFIIKELDAVLMQNSSRAEVTRALEAVCARLPTTIANECKAFVDQYAPAVIELLVSDLDPAQICTTLGLCSKLVQISPVKPINDGTCDVCKLLIQYIDSLLKENATEEEIMQLLEKICNFLPDTFKTECDNIVKEYGPMIAELIAQLADPLKVCTEIGLCTNSTFTHLLKKYDHHLQSKTVTDQRLLFKHPAGMDVACLTGPAEWCRNAMTAKKCGVHAVDYCRRHVWVS